MKSMSKIAQKIYADKEGRKAMMEVVKNSSKSKFVTIDGKKYIISKIK